MKRTTSSLALGRHPIEGGDLHASVFEYTSKPRARGIWEAHRRYVDVQYIVSGTERMGVANVADMDAGAYDRERDFVPLRGKGLFVPASAGMFFIFMPQDGHMAGVAAGRPRRVKRIVVKVRI